MARSAIPLYVTNQLVTAAHSNTYWRDNEAAHWVGTTAGDVDYYTAATTKSRLAIGTAGFLQRVNGGATAPEWFKFLGRQGGHATNWSTDGVNAYVPADWFMQCGSAEAIEAGAGDDADVTITYPVAFSDVPIFIAGSVEQTAGGARGIFSFLLSNQAAASIDVQVYGGDGLAAAFTVEFAWLAIGPE